MTIEPTEPEPFSSPGGQVIPLRSKVAIRPASFTRGDQAELADAALADILSGRPREWAIYDAGEVHVYAPGLGVWEAIPDYEVKSVVKSFAGYDVDSGQRRKGKQDSTQVKVNAPTTEGAYKLLRDDLRTEMDHRGGWTFAKAPRGLCFKNGFVSVRGGEASVAPHSPDHLARHRYEFDWTPGGRPLAFLAFLDSLFRDCSPKERADRIATLQEFMGICLMGEATTYARALVVYATGGNGKSELMYVIGGLFPPDTVTSLPPHQWGHNFRVMMLDGKLVNLVDEMPSDELASGESFKKIVTGGQVDAERKHRDPVIFRPIAGNIFNANQPLKSGDHSDGFWRRPLILPLTRVFENADYRAPDIERGIGARVLESDRAAIVSWAIDGAARLQRQKSYTESAASKAYVRSWREDSDQVRSFAAEFPLKERTAQSVLYESYTSWAKNNGHKPLSVTSFGQRVVAAGLATRVKASRVFYDPPTDPAETAERAAMQAGVPTEDLEAMEVARVMAAREAERLACG